MAAPTDSQKISAETLASALDGTEYGPVVQAGANRRQLNSQLLTYIQSALTTLANALSMSNQKITSLADPAAAQDAATKAYVDGVAQGLSIKGSVRLATAAALPANTPAAQTLTAVATGVLTVDGQTVALNDRVLVKDEVAQAGNGIYTCTTAGAVGVAFVLTRAADMNAAAEIPGAFAFVEVGTVNAGAGFVVAGEGPYIIGTTAIVWTQFSGAGEITAGNGLSKTGNTLAVNVDDSTIEIATDTLRAKDAGMTNAKLANVATATIKGRTTAGSGAPEDLTAAQARVVVRLDQRTTFSNADYAAQATDRYIAQIGTLSAARTVTLPAANALNAGQELIIADESGTVTAANTIIIARAGSDTIDGQTSLTMRTPYGSIRLFSDGTSKWTLDLVTPIRGGAVAEGRGAGGGTTFLTVPGVNAFSQANTRTLTANRIYYEPMIVATAITLDQLVIEVTTAGASGKVAHLAIYNADLSWQPTSRVLDAGNVAVDPGSVPTMTVASINVTLPPGRYLRAIISDGTPTLRTWRGGGGFLGIAPTGGTSPIVSGIQINGSGTTLPDPGTAWTGSIPANSAFDQMILCRVSVP